MSATSNGPPLLPSLSPSGEGHDPRAAFSFGPLHSDSQLPEWGALCAAGFSHRPGDPDRFRKKYGVDPTACLRLTRVATSSADGRLAGTIRIFRRDWVLEPGSREGVRTVGLGEVCTHPDFRGRGIAPVLMRDTLDTCEAEADAAGGEAALFSSLHAAAAVAPLYARFGYTTTLHVHYGRLRVPLPGGGGGEGGSSVTPWASPVVIVPGSNDAAAWAPHAARLGELHEELCAALGTVGHTVRDGEYWARWMPHVAGARLFLATSDGVLPAGSSAAVLGYAVVLRKNGQYKLADAGLEGRLAAQPAAVRGLLEGASRAAFFADAAEGKAGPEAAEGGADPVFAQGVAVPSALLRLAVLPGEAAAESAPAASEVAAAAGAEGGAAAEPEAAAAAAAPTPAPAVVLDDASWLDDGWMLRPLTGRGDAGSAASPAIADASAAAVRKLAEASAAGKALVWMADSF